MVGQGQNGRTILIASKVMQMIMYLIQVFDQTGIFAYKMMIFAYKMMIFVDSFIMMKSSLKMMNLEPT